MCLKKWEILKDPVSARSYVHALDKEYNLHQINPYPKDMSLYPERVGFVLILITDN
jgi:hypothetical protein